jgi:hypothetical protein
MPPLDQSSWSVVSDRIVTEQKLIVLQWTDLRLASKGACSACHQVIDVSSLPANECTDSERPLSQHVEEMH